MITRSLTLHGRLATPALMRAARGAYARSVQARLHAIGIADLPRNGAFILAGIGHGGGPGPDLPGDLGVTKQAVSQVTDILVSRGYAERSPDPADRRRVTLALTEPGRQVVEAVARGVEAVDLQLRERVPAGQVDDLAAALAHYAALGFTTLAYEGGGDYGFADRDGTGLHLAARPGHDPARAGAAAYLYVRDADALYAERSRPGIGGHARPAGPTPGRLREGSHTGPDGNLIRFGSPVGE
jgi:DNA-binding MarR family transcriptional regulator